MNKTQESNRLGLRDFVGAEERIRRTMSPVRRSLRPHAAVAFPRRVARLALRAAGTLAEIAFTVAVAVITSMAIVLWMENRAEPQDDAMDCYWRAGGCPGERASTATGLRIAATEGRAAR